MRKYTRKQIDIDDETLQVIKFLAVLNHTNLQKYIEGMLVQHVKSNYNKISEM